jgi:hypothetical protein
MDIYIKNINMKKVVRLTESDLIRIVKKVINENQSQGMTKNSISKSEQADRGSKDKLINMKKLELRQIIREEIQNEDLNEFWGKKITKKEVIEKLNNLINDKTADGNKELKDEFKMNSNQKAGLKSLIDSGLLDDFAPSRINNNITSGNAKATAKDIVIMTRGKGKGFSAASV